MINSFLNNASVALIENYSITVLYYDYTVIQIHNITFELNLKNLYIKKSLFLGQSYGIYYMKYYMSVTDCGKTINFR